MRSTAIAVSTALAGAAGLLAPSAWATQDRYGPQPQAARSTRTPAMPMRLLNWPGKTAADHAESPPSAPPSPALVAPAPPPQPAPAPAFIVIAPARLPPPAPPTAAAPVPLATAGLIDARPQAAKTPPPAQIQWVKATPAAPPPVAARVSHATIRPTDAPAQAVNAGPTAQIRWVKATPVAPVLRGAETAPKTPPPLRTARITHDPQLKRPPVTPQVQTANAALPAAPAPLAQPAPTVRLAHGRRLKTTPAATQVQTTNAAPARPPSVQAAQTVAAGDHPAELPPRRYSVARQFGLQPDPIPLPAQFFADGGSPDLAAPPPALPPHPVPGAQTVNSTATANTPANRARAIALDTPSPDGGD